jgi:hypothetical protein
MTFVALLPSLRLRAEANGAIRRIPGGSLISN